jgi:hypothetical protein
LRDWHNQYSDQGLVIIGVHSPEFNHEKDPDNVRKSIERLDVPYPVVLDNDFRTWRGYQNRYWPTLYLVDKRGTIRFWHIGEGGYTETEEAINKLLDETP